jgi:geranylgeranyl diphosphate synthase, type I
MDATETMMKRIDTAIASFLDKKIAEAGQVSPESQRLIENVKEFSLRKGKRIRPLMVVNGYKCFKEDYEQDIIDASICTELLHNYLLIHDDIMDESNLRRGLPTFHKVYEEIYTQIGIEKPEPYAINSSILAGDVLAALSSQPIIDSPFPDNNKLNAISVFNRTNSLTGYGQEIDILLELKKDPVMDDVTLVHTLKTANYTIKGPLHIGAILAGANDQQLKVLGDYAIPAGRAFQIQDDILGVFGSEEKIGKPRDSDLKEGKKTTLVIYALENGNEQQKKVLQSILGNTAIGEAEVEQAQKIFEETGALDRSKKLAHDLAQQAFNTVSNADFLPKGKNFLIEQADKLVNRDY